MVTDSRNVNAIQRLLRNHGLRATPQRLAVGEMVLSRPVHVTAREVWQCLRKLHPAISLNTIYQTLGQFESKGLLQRLEVGGVTVFDSNTEPHDHACCERCHAIVDVSAGSRSAASEDGAMPPAGWSITGVRHIWLGVCPSCRAADAGDVPTA